MIRWASQLQFLGYLVLGLTAAVGLSLSLALFNGDEGRTPLLVSFVAYLGIGLILCFGVRPEPHEFTHREGILLVVLSWTLLCLLGAVPFYLSPVFPSLADALFESVSGFTTTGATVLPEVERLPDSLLFFRALSHWFGGMGIILLGVAVLPLIGAGGMEMYRAEFSGARSERLRPRVAETAAALWKIYVVFTIVLYVCLRLAGMDLLDAVCHAFSAMATGGFSTRTASIGAFESPLIEYLLVGFMILAGINFTRHYRLFVERRPGDFFRDVEIRLFVLIVVVATLGLFVYDLSRLDMPLEEAFRASFFQVTAIVTTTGFTTADFGSWTSFSQIVLLALMFTGGCTGSTSGGLKTVRLAILLRVVRREFQRLAERRGVFSIRLGDEVIGESAVQNLLNLVYLAFLINFVASILLTAMGLDLLTSISAVAAAMFNIGPGLGEVGPASNFGHLPAAAKWVLSFCMLAGRLEFYTVLVIFFPFFWRK